MQKLLHQHLSTYLIKSQCLYIPISLRLNENNRSKKQSMSHVLSLLPLGEPAKKILLLKTLLPVKPTIDLNIICILSKKMIFLRYFNILLWIALVNH